MHAHCRVTLPSGRRLRIRRMRLRDLRDGRDPWRVGLGWWPRLVLAGIERLWAAEAVQAANAAPTVKHDGGTDRHPDPYWYDSLVAALARAHGWRKREIENLPIVEAVIYLRESHRIDLESQLSAAIAALLPHADGATRKRTLRMLHMDIERLLPPRRVPTDDPEIEAEYRRLLGTRIK